MGFGRVVRSRDGAELLSVSSSSSLFQSANEERKREESSADSQIREKRSPFYSSGTSRIGSRSDEQQRAIVDSFWNAGG